LKPSTITGLSVCPDPPFISGIVALKNGPGLVHAS
jgi:hypothetical protein